MAFARRVGEGRETVPFFAYPFANSGMMFQRSVFFRQTGRPDRAGKPDFCFLQMAARSPAQDCVAEDVTLERCSSEGRCQERQPVVTVGGSGASDGAFVDNAEIREHAFPAFRRPRARIGENGDGESR